ncbi:hypothetical protein N9934_03350 [Desulfosarcina sp.]|nr:hypothetical protein [Desulfosarcina sp.]
MNDEIDINTKEEVMIRGYVTRALDKACGDYAAALSMLKAELLPDGGQPTKVRATLELAGLKQFMYQGAATRRRKIEANPVAVRPVQVTQNRSKRNGKAAMSVVAPAIKSILNTWQVGSKLLGDCTATDLEREVASCEGKVQGWNKKLRFYSRLKDLMPDGGILRDAVTDEIVHRELTVSAAA